MLELTQEFYFEAAHTLSRSLEAEPSLRIHGHTYHADVTIRGEPDPQTGMIVDLAVLRAHIEAVRQLLDHRLLNDVPGLGRPRWRISSGSSAPGSGKWSLECRLCGSTGGPAAIASASFTPV